MLTTDNGNQDHNQLIGLSTVRYTIQSNF